MSLFEKLGKLLRLPRLGGGGDDPVYRLPRGRILVVEDELLIAAEIESFLTAAGFEVIGPAASVSYALALLERDCCDAAVLDVSLGEETSEPIATGLIRRGTPFVVVSGYARTQLPAVFQKAPLIGKPLPSAVLTEEVKRCFEMAGAPHGRA